MSKPFDYSKWDKIELSDDVSALLLPQQIHWIATRVRACSHLFPCLFAQEDDVHPNIDRESWFRMKHRSRVEREENEEKDKTKIREEVSKLLASYSSV